MPHSNHFHIVDNEEHNKHEIRLQKRRTEITLNLKRYRRFLNDLLSDIDDPDVRLTDQEDVLSEDERIVNFEWKSYFSNAPEKFISDPQFPIMNTAEKKKTNIQRACDRAKRRRRQLNYRENCLTSAHQENNKTVTQRLAALGLNEGENTDDTLEERGVSDASIMSTSTWTNTDQNDDEQTKRVSIDTQQKHCHSYYGQNDDFHQLTKSNIAKNLLVELYHCIPRSVRRSYNGMTDFVFITELEQLLVSFKFGALNAQQAALLKFGTFFVEQPFHSKPEDLTLRFKDAFHAHLAHGGLVFHQLISYKLSNNDHLCFVRLPRRNIIPHHNCKLVDAILFTQRSRNV